jgi:cbb3-type cytochrome oxidase maturation protein
MSVMILLIAFSLSVAVAFLLAFIVSTKRGQFDDVHTPSMRILLDEEPQENNTSQF